MRRKIIILIISIIIPILGAIGIGIYDYKVWYNPDSSAKNGPKYQNDYRNYLVSKKLDMSGTSNADKLRKTLERITLFKEITGYYYNEEPIFHQDVLNDKQEKLFTLDIYECIGVYQPNADTNEDRKRYESYIYNVNYQALNELFMDPSVRPANKNEITNTGFPTLIINFFPNIDYNEEEGIYAAISQNPNTTFTLYNGKIIYGSQLNTEVAPTLYDYTSYPEYYYEENGKRKLNFYHEYTNTYDKPDDRNPFKVQYLNFYDYTRGINIDDTTNATDKTERSRFVNGAYVKVDAILQGSQNWVYDKGSLLKAKVEKMDFRIDNINLENYKIGFHGKITDIKIEGALTYNQWVFTKFVWWQCLIALAVLGGIMVGFYFTFTYEEPDLKKTTVKNLTKHKKNNKKQKKV